MRFRLVEAERAQHPVSLLCKVLGVTSAGYYAWRRRGPSLRLLGDAELQRLLVEIHDGSLQTYGAPRIHAELADEHGQQRYRKRKRTVEPLFGDTKHNGGFYRFHRRGRIKVRLEWRLLMMTHNLTKVHHHQLATIGA